MIYFYTLTIYVIFIKMVLLRVNIRIKMIIIKTDPHINIRNLHIVIDLHQGKWLLKTPKLICRTTILIIITFIFMVE